jgi:phage terminase large subunit GpA-like protein
VHPALIQIRLAHLDAIRPRRYRRLADFAEQEITLAKGDYAGMKFNRNTVPWTAAVFNEMENPRWRRIFGRGAVQSGKTLLFYVIPALYHLFEIGEDIILAAPDVEMAQSKYYEDMLPAIEKTRYKELLPLQGSGSRGGKTKLIKFRNGASVRFMGCGGSDAQRSSYTARVVFVTEVDREDQPGEYSREADPIRQLEARTAAFGERARIYGECTTTTEDGRIYLETTVLGSDTRILIQCPFCRKFLYPDRSGLIGWQEAETEVQAHEGARYKCQHCEKLWTDADRLKAIRNIRLIHKGQELTPEGQVVGPLPQTYTLGVVWTSLHSPMHPMGKTAELEWRKLHVIDPEQIEKELCQWHYAVPYMPAISAAQLSYRFLADHAGDYSYDPRGVLREEGEEPPEGREPDGIVFRICAVDVQKRELYVLVDGYDRELGCWSLLWTVVEIVQEGITRDPSEEDLRVALDRALAIAHAYECASLWVDTGFRHEGMQEHVVRRWCAEQSACPLVGRSQGVMNVLTGKRMELPPDVPDMIQARQQPDSTVLWFLDVDRLKDEVYYRLFREKASPGYHWFARQAANERRNDRNRAPASPGWIFSHYMRVKREIELQRGREARTWVERGRHDLFDCAAYSMAGAMVQLAYILDAERNPPPPEPVIERPRRWREGMIRMEY